MEVTRAQLSEKFKLYNDDELLKLYRSGDLTELASEIAKAELASRGIAAATPATAVPPVQMSEPVATPAPVIDGDLVMAARLFDPTEAEMLRGRLEAEGVPAIVVDTNAARTISLYLALGGVRILVPEAYLERAREVIKADARGEYAIDEATDVGPSTESPQGNAALVGARPACGQAVSRVTFLRMIANAAPAAAP